MVSKVKEHLNWSLKIIGFMEARVRESDILNRENSMS